MEARNRMVYDVKTNEFDYSKRRTTDLKNKARVIFQNEAKMELVRIEAMQVFKQYVKEKCDKWGRQDNNLNRAESRGLKQLLKRTK